MSLRRLYKHKTEVHTLSLIIMILALWISLGRDIYQWWTFDRVLNNCVEEKLYRCDIGETRVFITYNGDTGPDE